jgi:hypothetical protein
MFYVLSAARQSANRVVPWIACRPPAPAASLSVFCNATHMHRCMTSTTHEGDPEIGKTDGGSGGDNDTKSDNKTIARALAKSQCPVSGKSLQTPAGLLFKKDYVVDRGRHQKPCDLEELLPKDQDNFTEVVTPTMNSEFFIPQVKLHRGDGSERKRVLV